MILILTMGAALLAGCGGSSQGTGNAGGTATASSVSAADPAAAEVPEGSYVIYVLDEESGDPIEDEAKRAATSAIRPEPLVTTIKLTKTNIAKTITPITKLLPMIKPPKALITSPAASGPKEPRDNIRRVEARFSANR